MEKMVDRYTLDPRIKVLLADLGICHANVLRRAGLPADLLSRSAVTLSSEEYRRLWGGLEAEFGDGTFPLSVMEASSAAAFSPPMFAALCSADLNQAARRLEIYKPLIGPMRLEVEVGERETTIACRWLDGRPTGVFALTEMLFWVSLSRIATRSDVRPTALTVAEPPVDQTPYLDALGIAVGADARHAITFAAADAARPFLTASDEMWEQFEPSLRTRLAEVDTSATTEDRVRAALVELLPAGRSSMRDVGRSMAMSTRTLQRRLGSEGTSFQAVLASTREALARHYLTSETISTGEISFLLGYADPSSFYRAFHEWTGLTPDRVRLGVA